MDDDLTPEQQEILNRFVYRAPTLGQKTKLDEVHLLVMTLARYLVTRLPNSRDRALALTSLEDTRMKINKAIVFSPD